MHELIDVFISRDEGGMSIIISALVGRKELLLCHRDDGMLLYHGNAYSSSMGDISGASARGIYSINYCYYYLKYIGFGY